MMEVHNTEKMFFDENFIRSFIFVVFPVRHPTTIFYFLEELFGGKIENVFKLFDGKSVFPYIMFLVILNTWKKH